MKPVMRVITLPMSAELRTDLARYVATNQPLTLSKLICRVLKCKMVSVEAGPCDYKVNEMVSARVIDEDWQKAKGEAVKRGLTYSSFLRSLLIDFLNEHAAEDVDNV